MVALNWPGNIELSGFSSLPMVDLWRTSARYCLTTLTATGSPLPIGNEYLVW